MDEELKKQIEALDTRRAEILFALCENEKLFYPEVILGLVHEARSITKILKILRGSNDQFKP